MKSYLTDEEEDALRTCGLHTNTIYVIRGVMNTQFSIARHYGGCKIGNDYYTYLPPTDELIRDDVHRWLIKRRKAAAEAKAKVKRIDEQGELF
jgi:hypothetical protein